MHRWTWVPLAALHADTQSQTVRYWRVGAVLCYSHTHQNWGHVHAAGSPCLLPVLTPVLASNFTLWQNWCRLCICKLSQLIPHAISSSSPTTCNFCPTHLLRVVFWLVSQRRYPALQEFLSQISILQHGVQIGKLCYQAPQPKTGSCVALAIKGSWTWDTLQFPGPPASFFS